MSDLKRKSAAEVLADAASGKAAVYCGHHMYFGPGGKQEPTSGCKQCWLVYYLHHFSTVPREQLEERIAALEAAVRHSVEAVEKGVFDFVPYRHPEIVISKEN